MAKKIEEISIFGEYTQPENRVTAAFLQILKIGGEELLRFLAEKIKFDIPTSEIQIMSQVTNEHGVPDGLLSSSFSFRLFIESKIKTTAINPKQLDNHIKELKYPNDILIYLTPDEKKPFKNDRVFWSNWKMINDLFNEYLSYNPDGKELLPFLIIHFTTLLENFNLLGKTWNLNNDQVMIVAGSSGENVALKYNYYICQNKRSFKPSKYISFFYANRIKYIFTIIEEPHDDVQLDKHNEFDDYLKTMDPNYNGDLRKVFKLKLYKELNPIINDSRDKNGNLCPYTYGQPRYTSLKKMENSKKTSEL